MYHEQINYCTTILEITDHKNYGVINLSMGITLLYGYVEKNINSKQLTTPNWLIYIQILQKLANELNVTTRDIDRTVFECHKKISSKKKKNTKGKF